MTEVAMPEFVDNPEDRCPVVLLLDTSGSMSGEPIDQLNTGIQLFKTELQKDSLAALRVEIATVTFGPVEVRQNFVSVNDFDDSPLSISGATPTGEAINRAYDLLEARKQEYRQNNIMYYRPWIVLITDGAPTDEWNAAARRVDDAENAKHASFWAIGVEGADMDTLKQIAPPNRPPLKLKGFSFAELFAWLSNSLSQVSQSQSGEQLSLPAPTGWGEITA